MNKTLKRFHDVTERREKTDDPAEKIVFQIFNDLRHRNGFTPFWNLIELDTREEILAHWLEIVRRVLDRKPEPKRKESYHTEQLRALPVVKDGSKN